jgi:CDP-paratose 2-epimerase
MNVLVTGAAGLVGAAVARRFAAEGWGVLGVDNDMRRRFFGPEGSTAWQLDALVTELGDRFRPVRIDIRDRRAIEGLFAETRIDAVVHCAAQPSHDWAANDPHLDFQINANGTLALLEAARCAAIEAPFVYLSTNKVYGDRPNQLDLVEQCDRYDLPAGHRLWNGLREDMPVDQCQHSLFGVSKLAGDLLVQEYGRYFGMPTVALRGGCLTGPGHSGVELHGFLAYLTRCAVQGRPYTVIGYGGRQVRDNLHVADLAEVIWQIIQKPPAPGSVFNVGGGSANALSVREAIGLAQEVSGRRISVYENGEARQGDRQWYITDNHKLCCAYPGWRPERSLPDILTDLHAAMVERWGR